MNLKKEMQWTAVVQLLLILILVVLLAGCFGLKGGTRSAAEQPPAGEAVPQPQVKPEPALPAADSVPERDPIQEQLKGMSMAEKAGQLLIAGMEGTAVNEQTRGLLRDYHVGGIILYKDNVSSSTQLLALTRSLKEANRAAAGTAAAVPLWIGIDEEGGRVTRMPAELTRVPTAAAVGRSGREAAAHRLAQAMGRELAALGVNMDFAPVLDVNSNPANPVIGDRAFGSDPQLVSRMGVQAMKGLQSQGITAVVKHFPGHGDTSVDSHTSLPVVDHGLQRLRAVELPPFAAALQAGADAVMAAHILLPELDPLAPATLSRPIITGLLREEMGYDGVVITDDLTMGAISEREELGRAAVRAVAAGCDVLLVGHGHDAAVRAAGAVQEAVKAGELPMEQLDRSVYRILRLKHKYSLRDEAPAAVDVPALNAQLQEAVQAVRPGG